MSANSLALVEGILVDPFSEMAATVRDGAVRLERRMIAACTQTALAVMSIKREKTSGDVPFSYLFAEDGVHPEFNPAEYPAILRIADLRQPGFGERRIAATLSAEAFTPRGAAWAPGNVHRLADRMHAIDVAVGA